MVSEILAGYIDVMPGAINSVRPNLMYLMYILTVLNIAYLGINIALNKVRNEEIIEKIFFLLVTVFLVRNYVFIGNIVKYGIVQLSAKFADMDMSLIDHPEQLFSYFYDNIIVPYVDGMEAFIAQVSGDIGDDWGVSAAITALGATVKGYILQLFFNIFTLVILICVVIVIVQIVLTHINFYITLFFGQITIVTTLFEPTRFIGQNALKSIITSAITMGVTVFVAAVGMLVLRNINVNAWAVAHTSFIEALAAQWVMLASVIIYVFLCLKGPALIMSLISGMPTLGAGGLFSTISNIANTTANIVNAARGGGSSGLAPAQAPAATGAPGKPGGAGAGGASGTSPAGTPAGGGPNTPGSAGGGKAGFSPSNLLNNVGSATFASPSNRARVRAVHAQRSHTQRGYA
jgi:type IV secretory pathway TrbL component